MTAMLLDDVGRVVAEIRRRLVGRAAPLLVAFDGGSGAGKSTLVAAVAAELEATVVESDDFFSNDSTGAQWKVRTAAERMALCIDWRRLRIEALDPLLAGRTASWHPFDFARPGTGLATDVVTRRPAPVILLDGVYSSRPELADLIDFTVLVDTPASLRSERHDQREHADDAGWHAMWDVAEDYYFTHVRPPSSFDLIVGLG
jgi:uridine kinase